ncbi:hypothetical protein STAS_03803 [Striga asiatica]|uniref:Uncharacterized protein n=1 Tax=Striga asiatica TaxID=4170 RepID=A0A5A7P5K8_STRAF|nr:hypothetical protein STAS_03803 [Striga asiatica]
MGRLGCTAVGTLDDSKFNEPMPWIGAYVASASAACALAMAADAAHALRYRKLWFPSRFFSLNATTLTLIGVAVKLSVDLNTSMPRPHDQLSKLSSTAFLSTAIANSLPSLGSSSSSSDLMMNILALSILVLTVLVNVAIQLATGVIYVFLPEHILIISLTLILLGITVSSALAVPATKCYFELKYAKKYELAKTECSGSSDLKDDLARYWMMAHTCSPQFVVGRLATCTASGAYCLLSALTLAEAVLRSYFMPWCFTFCKGRSDYKWSVLLVLVTQAAAVLVGTIGPASRWFFAIKFRCPKRRKNSSQAMFSVENYWVQTLNQLKECPLDLRICSRHSKKIVHHVKNKALDLCILVQKVIVISSKFLGLLSIIVMSRLIAALSCCKRLVSFFRCNAKCADTESSDPNKSNSKLDLSRYVMHLEGEENLVQVMMESDRDTTGHFLKMGRKKQPKHLLHIIEKLEPSKGFRGVYAFDSKLVPPLDPTAEPPKSWALPVVTLTSIAVATSTDSDFNSVRELIKCVNEGLKYIRVVENSLDFKRTSANIRKAAEIVWVGVELHYRWLDVDLRETRLRGKSPKNVISELSETAKQKFVELSKKDPIGCLRYDPARWPVKALAANAMYRVCETLLLDKSDECGKSMFERLSAMIGDIIGACLTNLEQAISVKCHQSSIEQREESVRHAILLLGKTERILEIIGRQRVPSSDPEKLACINKWREMGNDRLSCGSTPTSSDFSAVSDLYLNVD